jgi:hypothetical protein
MTPADPKLSTTAPAAHEARLGPTTRRIVFGGAAQIAGFLGLEALPAGADAASSKRSGSNAEFIRSIGCLHENGARAARQALAGGMRGQRAFTLSSRPASRGNFEPVLCFKQGDANCTVRPDGRHR